MTICLVNSWEGLLDQFLQYCSDPAMVTDLQGKIVLVNDKMLELVGLDRDRAIGQPYPYSWILAQGNLDGPPWMNEIRESEGAAKVESLITDAQGSPRLIRFSTIDLRSPDGLLEGLLSIGRDVTPPQQGEEPLAGPDSYLPRLFDEIPAWLQLSQLDGTIEIVNQAACAISGFDRSEMTGQVWPYSWFPSGWSEAGEDPFGKLSRSGEVLAFEAACVTRQGKTKDLDVVLSLVPGGSRQNRRVLMVALDMTERKQRAERILQAEKIRVVTQLASGVAHDINNDLAVILGFSEYLLAKCEGLNEQDRHALNAIQQQAQECAETVRRIQLFSRRPPRSNFTYFSINDVVRDAVKSMEHLWAGESSQTRSGIQLEADLQWVPPVHAHLNSLKETVIGLVENAVAALPEGGKVALRTRENEGEVVLEVSDDGAGIDPGQLQHIFEPFFTTKGPASSGLGLSIVHHLVAQMDGKLSVESTPGTGTTFTVRLPAAQADLASPSEALEPDTSERKLHVMVVDDEPLVAGMLQTILESAGHRATVFLDAAEAVEAFSEGQFDLLVVDLAMPGMDGWEVSRRINEICPGVPIIVVTGSNTTADDGERHGAVVDTVLWKPSAMGELAQAIAEAIRRRAPTNPLA